MTKTAAYPYRVYSYQFKELEDARKFNADLESGRYRVMMAHTGSDGVAILLDVTDDAPDVAEAKWATK